MRIASLVPSATEIVAALGLTSDLVAVTHECDHPPEVATLPQLTRSVIEPGLPAAEIDARVLELTGRGEALYVLDEDRLAELEPELILTQALCAVCAVSVDDVRSVAERLPNRPAVLSLDPTRLGEVLGDIVRVAEAVGDADSGERVRTRLAARMASVERPRTPPRMLALEWLDPPYLGGHWVPEMIAAVGGLALGPEPGERSRTASWEELRGLEPEIVVVMPCGLYADEASAEALRNSERLRSLGARSVFAVDAAASFSRPGPRLADGVELLSAIARGAAPDGAALGCRDLSAELGAG